MPWDTEYLQLLLQWPGDQLDNAVSLRPSKPGAIWGEGDTPGFTARLPIELVGAPGLEFGQQQRFLWDRRQHASNKHSHFLLHLPDSDAESHCLTMAWGRVLGGNCPLSDLGQ